MPSLRIAPKFNLAFHTEALDQQIDALAEGGAITALIFNDARSPEGTYYFTFVDRGRGPVKPIRAKVLHWVDPKTGKDVFARYAKAVAPRHIVARALAQIQQAEPPVDLRNKSLREAVEEFVDGVAALAVQAMIPLTPVVTGQLKGSYRIESSKTERE